MSETKASYFDKYWSLALRDEIDTQLRDAISAGEKLSDFSLSSFQSKIDKGMTLLWVQYSRNSEEKLAFDRSMKLAPQLFDEVKQKWATNLQKWDSKEFQLRHVDGACLGALNREGRDCDSEWAFVGVTNGIPPDVVTKLKARVKDRWPTMIQVLDLARSVRTAMCAVKWEGYDEAIDKAMKTVATLSTISRVTFATVCSLSYK